MDYRELSRNRDLVDNNFWNEFYVAVKDCQRLVRISKKSTMSVNSLNKIKESISDRVQTIRCFIKCCE